MSKLRMFFLAIFGAWGAYQLMGPDGDANRQKVMGMADQLRGRFDQFMGDMTGSTSTSMRGHYEETRGIGRETVGDVQSTMHDVAGH